MFAKSWVLVFVVACHTSSPSVTSGSGTAESPTVAQPGSGAATSMQQKDAPAPTHVGPATTPATPATPPAGTVPPPATPNTAALPGISETCAAGDACAAGLSCVGYY